MSSGCSRTAFCHGIREAAARRAPRVFAGFRTPDGVPSPHGACESRAETPTEEPDAGNPHVRFCEGTSTSLLAGGGLRASIAPVARRPAATAAEAALHTAARRLTWGTTRSTAIANWPVGHHRPFVDLGGGARLRNNRNNFSLDADGFLLESQIAPTNRNRPLTDRHLVPLELDIDLAICFAPLQVQLPVAKTPASAA